MKLITQCLLMLGVAATLVRGDAKRGVCVASSGYPEADKCLQIKTLDVAWYYSQDTHMGSRSSGPGGVNCCSCMSATRVCALFRLGHLGPVPVARGDPELQVRADDLSARS